MNARSGLMRSAPPAPFPDQFIFGFLAVRSSPNSCFIFTALGPCALLRSHSFSLPSLFSASPPYPLSVSVSFSLSSPPWVLWMTGTQLAWLSAFCPSCVSPPGSWCWSGCAPGWNCARTLWRWLMSCAHLCSRVVQFSNWLRYCRTSLAQAWNPERNASRSAWMEDFVGRSPATRAVQSWTYDYCVRWSSSQSTTWRVSM